MKTCIFTIIKDEQEYLDEWIKYHLDLGIDHIFIYEDIDSMPHNEICNKYKDKVTLKNILDIYSDEEKEKALKARKEYLGFQNNFSQKGLKYVQENYPMYNWCFLIDSDEFITLEDKNKSLQDVIELYKDYDAFIMQWEIYGACGLIHKPSYKDKGVVDTYTQPAYFYKDNQWLTKTCYNLKTYNESNFLHVHQPSFECKWCNSNFEEHERDKQVYNNIYIRHYITRSWEEFVWKHAKRGYLVIGTYLEDFFDINLDLMDEKERLLAELKKEEGI